MISSNNPAELPPIDAMENLCQPELRYAPDEPAFSAHPPAFCIWQGVKTVYGKAFRPYHYQAMILMDHQNCFSFSIMTLKHTKIGARNILKSQFR